MWSREFLKDRAKAVLKVSYWKAFLVSLIIAIVGGNHRSSFNYNFGNNNSIHGTNFFGARNIGIFPFLVSVGILIIVIISIILFALAFRIFLGYPLEVGGRRYFVQAAQKNINLNCLVHGFEQREVFRYSKSYAMERFSKFSLVPATYHTWNHKIICLFNGSLYIIR